MSQNQPFTLLGKKGAAIQARTAAAKQFLDTHSVHELLTKVGTQIPDLPEADHFSNDFIQLSSHKSQDHFLTGKGLFFVTEQGTLILDCTAGHYQMPWGYQPENIVSYLEGGIHSGITWDCHSDIPGNPVKALANELVALANGLEGMDDPRLEALRDADDVLNRAIVSTCTGTVACAAAFRMAFLYYAKHYAELGPPVFLTFENNYHGTDTFAQRMRGMWDDLFNPETIVFEQIQPNNIQALEALFNRYGNRVASVFFEPVMMNNEALYIKPDVVHKMRELTRKHDAMLVADEIQSCFFVPEMMMFLQYDIDVDAVVVGKGLTAGFHGQSATIFKSKYDLLAQFDALSTNGNAPLAAIAGLACISEIKAHKSHLKEMQNSYFSELQAMVKEYPELIEEVMGYGLLSGLKFYEREKALEARKQLLEQGLWVRVHAYKEGHQTLLMKFALIVEKEVITFFMKKVRNVLDTLDTI